MAIVRVPKTPRSSFDPSRPPSKLLLDQIDHLRWAALPASQRKPHAMTRYKKAKTEGQAAAHIEELTEIVMKAKAAPAADAGVTPPRVTLPALPKIPRKKAKTTKKKPQKSKNAKGRKAKTARARR